MSKENLQNKLGKITLWKNIRNIQTENQERKIQKCLCHNWDERHDLLDHEYRNFGLQPDETFILTDD